MLYCFWNAKGRLKFLTETPANLSYAQEFEGSDASIVLGIGSIVGYKRTLQRCICKDHQDSLAGQCKQ